MRILIDIGHPAHVHLFKNFCWQMRDRSHDILLTCRDRENVIHLIEYYNFDYICFGKHAHSILLKILRLPLYNLKMLLTSLKFQPHIYLSHGSMYAAFSSWLLRKHHISFEDTFNMEQIRLYLPFTDVVLTGDYPHTGLGKKELSYPGYHELAYLHPNVFQPDEKVLNTLGVEPGEMYAIIRFVAWNATHDTRRSGISRLNRIKLVNILACKMRVFISSEEELHPEFRKYQISIKPEDIHSALAFAQVFIGESSTMAAESAVLGTPAIYVNDSQLGYTNDLQDYNLLFSYTGSVHDQESAMRKLLEIATSTDRLISRQRVSRMLQDKIDVSAFLLWFVENYPMSLSQARGNPELMQRFR